VFLNKQRIPKQRNCLRICHVNIQGLIKKLPELDVFIEESSAHVVCLCEHWLRECEIKLITLSNFSFATNFSRQNMRRGGTAIFVKSDLPFDVIDCTKYAVESDFEVCAVRVAGVVVVEVYRVPQYDISNFIDRLDLLLNDFNSNRKTVICGDFNLDILKPDSRTNQFLSLLQSYNFEGIVDAPTRVAGRSATCIDNFFVNFNDNVKNENLINLVVPFTDHNFLSFDIALVSLPSSKPKVCYRNFSETNMWKFVDEIHNLSWETVYNSLDINSKISSFYSVFKPVYESAFPIKHRVASKGKSWITQGIKISSRHKRLLYCLIRRLPDPILLDHYKSYCRILRNVVKVAKRLHLDDIIKGSGNIPKTIWNVIKRELGQNNISVSPIHLTVGDRLVTSSQEVCNIFNDHFASIQNRPIASGSSGCFADKLNTLSNNVKTFFLYPTDPYEVQRIILSLNNTSSTGIDEIPVKVLKSVVEYIKMPISHMINCSFETGIYPHYFKLSKIVPLYKKKKGQMSLITVL